jgi:hypothetical protein
VAIWSGVHTVFKSLLFPHVSSTSCPLGTGMRLMLPCKVLAAVSLCLCRAAPRIIIGVTVQQG